MGWSEYCFHLLCHLCLHFEVDPIPFRRTKGKSLFSSSVRPFPIPSEFAIWTCEGKFTPVWGMQFGCLVQVCKCSWCKEKCIHRACFGSYLSGVSTSKVIHWFPKETIPWKKWYFCGIKILKMKGGILLNSKFSIVAFSEDIIMK